MAAIMIMTCYFSCTQAGKEICAAGQLEERWPHELIYVILMLH